MSFRNPIVAGNVLVRNAIQSPNYAAGSAGWIIRRDGTAEFNAAIFRGTVVIESGNAVLIYSSATPQVGTLVLSLAGAAGTDSVGNAYPEGLAIVPDASPSLRLGLLSGSAIEYWPSGVTGELNAAATQMTTPNGTTTSGNPVLVIKSAQMLHEQDYVALNLVGSSDDGTRRANFNVGYVDTSAVAHFYLAVTSAGAFAPANLTVGANSSLGDNGLGELALANATTAPTTDPTGGCVLYAHQGVPSVLDPGGNLLGMVRAYSARCNANLNTFTAETAVPGASTNVVVTGSNATVLITAVFDMECSTSICTLTGRVKWNGVDLTPQAIFVGTAVGDRKTVAQTYEITGVTAGSYPLALYATASVSGAINQVSATHTGFTALLIDQ